jgi:hypothetical protein
LGWIQPSFFVGLNTSHCLATSPPPLLIQPNTILERNRIEDMLHVVLERSVRSKSRRGAGVVDLPPLVLRLVRTLERAPEISSVVSAW